MYWGDFPFLIWLKLQLCICLNWRMLSPGNYPEAFDSQKMSGLVWQSWFHELLQEPLRPTGSFAPTALPGQQPPACCLQVAFPLGAARGTILLKACTALNQGNKSRLKFSLMWYWQCHPSHEGDSWMGGVYRKWWPCSDILIGQWLVSFLRKSLFQTHKNVQGKCMGQLET